MKKGDCVDIKLAIMERRTAVDTIYLENSGFRRIGRTSCYSFTDNQQTMPLNVNTTTIITKRQTLLRITSHSLPLWIDPPVFPPCRTTFLCHCGSIHLFFRLVAPLFFPPKLCIFIFLPRSRGQLFFSSFIPPSRLSFAALGLAL